MSTPLVTFALFAYNQDKFIRKAVEGALSQTYSPLEIILSDDCSSDSTFAIMQQMAAAYRGSHRVKLQRTDRNRGLAGNINYGMAMASGELVVFAAGDDCSLPHRVEKLTSEWVGSGKPSGIGSGLREIDENGHFLNISDWALTIAPLLNSTPRDQLLRDFATRRFSLLGCSAAWSKETWDRFGDLMESVVNEDDALSFRSLLDRGLRFVEEPLVLYRLHTNNIWNKTSPTNSCTPGYCRSCEERAAKRATLISLMYENALRDLTIAVSKHLIQPTIARTLEADILRTISGLEIRAKWWDFPFFTRLCLFSNSPHRSFPSNVTSLLPLNQHSTLRCLLLRLRRRLY